MSASVLSAQQGVSVFTLTAPVNLVATPASPFTNGEYLNAPVSRVDYLGGVPNVSFDAPSSSFVFSQPGVYEMTSLLQAIIPADLSASPANTDEKGVFLMSCPTSSGASGIVESATYVPVSPAVGLSSAGTIRLSASGLIVVNTAGASVEPGLYTSGVISTGAGNPPIVVQADNTLVYFRQVA
jgi:hypothetical protein